MVEKSFGIVNFSTRRIMNLNWAYIHKTETNTVFNYRMKKQAHLFSNSLPQSNLPLDLFFANFASFASKYPVSRNEAEKLRGNPPSLYGN